MRGKKKPFEFIVDEVAREFNVSGSQIYRIWNGENWAREVSV